MYTFMSFSVNDNILIHDIHVSTGYDISDNEHVIIVCCMSNHS